MYLNTDPGRKLLIRCEVAEKIFFNTGRREEGGGAGLNHIVSRRLLTLYLQDFF
jgi:hypothetical protein